MFVVASRRDAGAAAEPLLVGPTGVQPLAPRLKGVVVSQSRFSPISGKRLGQVVVLVSVAALGFAMLPGSATAQSERSQGSAAAAAPAKAKSSGDKLGNYDSRTNGTNKQALEARKARLEAHPNAGVRSLSRQLGAQGIIDIDPVTGTPRQLARIDGFLSAPSSRSPEAIARSYVRQHQDVFGLNRLEVAALTLRKDYRDIGGTHHLSFVQTVNGVPVFGNGLKAHVDKRGRLIEFDGSPVANLPALLRPPALGAAAALQTAARATFNTARTTVERQRSNAARSTTFRNGD